MDYERRHVTKEKSGEPSAMVYSLIKSSTVENAVQTRTEHESKAKDYDQCPKYCTPKNLKKESMKNESKKAVTS